MDHVDEMSDGVEDLRALDEHIDEPQQETKSPPSMSAVANETPLPLDPLPETEAPPPPEPPLWVPPSGRELPDVPFPAHTLYLHVPGGGQITFYPKTKLFEVVCKNACEHGLCRITRYGTKPRGARALYNPGQGRSLGFMLAWIEECSQVHREQHKAHEPSFRCRCKWRNWLLDQPIGSVAWQLLGAERKLIAGESHYNGEPPHVR